MESGDPCTDADFCSLRSSLNFHEGDTTDRVRSLALSGACTPVSDQQPEDDCDFWKDEDPEYNVHLHQTLGLYLDNVPCEELNIFGLMHRCENDTCLAAAVLSSFFAQGLSCCIELQRAIKMNQRDQLLLQAVAF